MRFYKMLISFCILSATVAVNINQKMEADGIIPDTLDRAPSAKISVVYPGNKVVEFAGELTPTDVKQQPDVKWDTSPDKYYTLFMVDPDAPSKATPTYREINHWLVVNIKGCDITTGQTYASYRGSGPSKGSGLHRYIFIVFEHDDKITVTEEDLQTNRRNFSMKKFAKKYSLGHAYAGNYFQAQWDSSVPERKS